MAGLQDFRAQHPEYNDIPDQELADKLHAKFYSDMPKSVFESKMGVKPMSAGEVVGNAIMNVPESAGNVLEGIGSAVAHPVRTAEGVGKALLGAREAGTSWLGRQLGLDMEPPKNIDYRATPKAIGSQLAERYGGIENLKRTIATDPVGVALDASAVLGLGAPLLPGKAGTIARIASRELNPITQIARVPKAAGKLAGKAIGGAFTQTGGRSLLEAGAAGQQGGEVGKTFIGNLQGTIPSEKLINDMHTAVGKLRAERNAAYQADMGRLATDKTVLGIRPVMKAAQGAQSRAIGVSGIVKDETAATALSRVNDKIKEFLAQPPSVARTPQGMDELKQAIGHIAEDYPKGSNAAGAVNNVYHAVKNQIVMQAPTYAKTMKDYEEASNTLNEIRKTLSANPTATVDTQLRKLQSIFRNNANTNYGRRAELLKKLEDTGVNTISPAIAGQSLNSWLPRGMARVSDPLFLLGGGGAAYLAGNPGAVAALLPVAGMMSPKLMGYGAYGAGLLSRPFPSAANTGLLGQGLYQAGRQ